MRMRLRRRMRRRTVRVRMRSDVSGMIWSCIYFDVGVMVDGWVQI